MVRARRAVWVCVGVLATFTVCRAERASGSGEERPPAGQPGVAVTGARASSADAGALGDAAAGSGSGVAAATAPGDARGGAEAAGVDATGAATGVRDPADGGGAAAAGGQADGGAASDAAVAAAAADASARHGVERRLCEAACAHALELTEAELPADSHDEIRAAMHDAMQRKCPDQCVENASLESVRCTIKAASVLALSACPR